MATFPVCSPYAGLRKVIERVCQEGDLVQIGNLVDGSSIPPIGDDLEPHLQIVAALNVEPRDLEMEQRFFQQLIALCTSLASQTHLFRDRRWQNQVVNAVCMVGWLERGATSIPESVRARFLAAHADSPFLEVFVPDFLRPIKDS